MEKEDKRWRKIVDDILLAVIGLIWFAVIVCGIDSFLYRMGVREGNSVVAVVGGGILFCVYNSIMEKRRNKELSERLDRISEITSKYDMSIMDVEKIRQQVLKK